MEQTHFFSFESDFIAANIRCIPMAVRLKLDLVGIKMSLAAWSRCSANERKMLVEKPCHSALEKEQYAKMLDRLIRVITGEPPVSIPVENNPNWEEIAVVPVLLVEQADLYGMAISTGQWEALSPLQRFALVKLCRPGHENRNFPYAMHEFGLSEYLAVNALL